MIQFIRSLFGLKPKKRRAELRCLPYDQADKLIRETNGAWTIAPEEDKNKVIGIVYLERLVYSQPVCSYRIPAEHPLARSHVYYTTDGSDRIGPCCFDCYTHISDNFGGVKLLSSQRSPAK